ncbi:MAG: class I SAM-dependent methyltransferase [Planctomycetota bacterium]
MTALYDTLGVGYSGYRRPDPRIAARIEAALGDALTVVNVGAGAGSYEPRGRALLAVEPSAVMIAQRPAGAAPVVQASATRLPFRDGAFAASLAILTVHHWPDRARGLGELRRVARERVVLLTSDTARLRFWLLDYFPEILELDRQWMPTLAELEAALGPCQLHELPVPHDCCDGFLGAYWRRPAAYLDPEARRAISIFAQLPDVAAGLEALRRDLESGAWHERHGALLERDALDVGYRLVVAEG